VRGGRGQLREHAGQDHQDGHADRDVHEEDPLPSRSGGKQAASQHADGSAGASQGGPDAEGTVALLPLEEPDHDRESGRAEHCRAEALRDPAHEQQDRPVGQTRHERGEGEDRQPGDHEPAWPEEVSSPTTGEHQAAERQRVSAHHPRQLIPIEREVRSEVRKRYRDHGDVDDQHELGGAQQG
jgi:hypothetical protein